MVATIGSSAYLHPDFSSVSGGNYGIPYNVVGNEHGQEEGQVPVRGAVRQGAVPDPASIPRSRADRTATS